MDTDLCNKAVQTEGFEDKIDEWLEWDKNPETHEEIRVLRDLHGYPCLKQLLKTRLKFGSHGIRGRMGAGYSRINDLVVIQTTQGLVVYLESIHPEEVKQRGVVVGFDARHNSRRYAELAAVTLLGRGIRVYLFSEICPTPFVSFCVNINKCMAGIMITASHNPKYDNGYKVYWENGVQILPPHDKHIDSHIYEQLEPWENAWDTTIIKNNKLLRDPLVQVSGMYFKHLRRSVLQPEINKAASLKVTYTAMHGVAHRFMVEAFKAGYFNPIIPVNEQKDPKPDFPTLEFPNPEDKHALKKAIATADYNLSTLVLATDPDGDRLAVAQKCQVYGDDDDDNEAGEEEWRVLTCNEVGALLAWWTLYNHRQRNPSADLADVYMLGTVVTTKLLESMARAEGFTYEETPYAGFAYLASMACDLVKQGKTVLFGFDEPIGYMIGTNILDKDGISAGMNVAALAAHLETENLTLADKLDELYSTYGHHLSHNSYLWSHDEAAIENVFHRLRHFREDDDDEANTYPESVDDGKYLVVRVRDFATGYDSARQGEEATAEDPPAAAVNEMIKFVFDNGVSLSVRGAATAGGGNKLNYYADLCVPPGDEDVWSYRDTLDEMTEAIVREFFQPELNGFFTREA